MPTGYAPHKTYGGVEMTKHRCEMVRRAVNQNEHFSVSTYEVDRTQVNYTYMTLQAVQEMYPEAELYFILGADSLFDFDKWRFPDLICKQATILAAVRDYLTESKVDQQIQLLREQYGGAIYRLDTPNFNVSSKVIRTRLEKGETIRYMVPDAVKEYIEDNQLYASEIKQSM